MLKIESKVKDSTNKIIGCMVVDLNTGFKNFIKKSDLSKYSYVNAKISSDLRILSSTDIPSVFLDDIRSNGVILYHGSHSGIRGDINACSSRDLCDFGTGFYTGDSAKQAKTIIVDDAEGVFYRLEVDFRGLDVYRFTDDILWALYVAVNRGRIPKGVYKKLDSIVDYINSRDVVIGLIADDRMMFVYNSFINGTISSRALSESLKYVDLGHQYVFKKNSACKNIKIVKSCILSEDEKKALKHDKSRIIGKLPDIVDDLMYKYRFEGYYFRDLLEKYK